MRILRYSGVFDIYSVEEPFLISSLNFSPLVTTLRTHLLLMEAGVHVSIKADICTFLFTTCLFFESSAKKLVALFFNFDRDFPVLGKHVFVVNFSNICPS